MRIARQIGLALATAGMATVGALAPAVNASAAEATTTAKGKTASATASASYLVYGYGSGSTRAAAESQARFNAVVQCPGLAIERGTGSLPIGIDYWTATSVYECY